MDNILILNDHEIDLIENSLIIMTIFYKKIAEICLDDGYVDVSTKNNLNSMSKIKDLYNSLIKINKKEDKIILMLSKIILVKKAVSEINFICSSEYMKNAYQKIYEKIKNIK